MNPPWLSWGPVKSSPSPTKPLTVRVSRVVCVLCDWGWSFSARCCCCLDAVPSSKVQRSCRWPNQIKNQPSVAGDMTIPPVQQHRRPSQRLCNLWFTAVIDKQYRYPAPVRQKKDLTSNSTQLNSRELQYNSRSGQSQGHGPEDGSLRCARGPSPTMLQLDLAAQERNNSNVKKSACQHSGNGKRAN